MKQPITSPCIKVCAVDGKTGWCLGCGRSLKEISQWTKYTDQQRDDVIDACIECGIRGIDNKTDWVLIKGQGKRF